MALATGLELGPYEIISPIGAGGMGEVYSARDTRLNRKVAIKVLPPALSDDPEFRTRFEREAHAISSLAHPNICTLYDVGSDPKAGSGARGINYLVLEYVEGESLASRLQRGPLPMAQVLAVAAQLADALAAAHRAGVVHRDVKPANIILTKTGAKLLDFGIAKPRLTVARADALLETMPAPMTARGAFIGTPNYMAPEQVEGGEADARTDLFALGAVIHEMATGRKAFDGKSSASVIASILAHDPPSVSSVQPMSPPALDRVVRKCLEKDPDLRWQSAADLATALRWIDVDDGRQQPRHGATKFRWLPALVAGVLLAVAALLVAPYYMSKQTAAAPPLRAFIPAPPDVAFAFMGDQGGGPVISHDGRALVFAGYSNGRRMLFVRSTDDTVMRPLSGTEGGKFPFWSPDGRSVGFFADGQLKRVDIAGGQATTLAQAPDGRGGSWGDGFILFAPTIRDGIHRVSADGGKPVQLTTLDTRVQTTHRWPVVLPDSRHFLFYAGNHTSPGREGLGIYLGFVDGTPPKFLVPASGGAMYVPGYVLYPRGSTLVAQRFDTERLALVGDAIPIGDVTFDATTWRVIATASDNGILAFEAGTPGRTHLTWYDRTGKQLSTIATATDAAGVAMSADGTRLAVNLSNGPAPDAWIYDVKTGEGRRLTFLGGNGAVLSPDGNLVAFSSRRDQTLKGRSEIYVKHADGTGSEQKFYSSDLSVEVTDWSRDGRYMLLNKGEVPSRSVWALPLFGEREAFPVLKADYNHFDGRLSPDGRWMVYSSTETNVEEIFVTSFPQAEGKWQISVGGGTQAQWRSDGKEIFFITPDSNVASVSVSTSGNTLQTGPERKLFHAPFLSPSSGYLQYAVTRDGQKFLLPAAEHLESTPITIRTNWPAALGR